jgi:hypothetical protein
VASAALRRGPAKERAGDADSDDAATSAAAAVAGFPGSSAVTGANQKTYFPMMGDPRCKLTAGGICPSDAAAPMPRMMGMLRHRCDTGKGMSGAPLWLQDGTAQAMGAAAIAAANGFPGSRPAGSGGEPAVALGGVSRHFGDCPWGADCANYAAPMDERVVSFIRQWVSRA